jgi:hypothetical protein
MPLNGKVAWVLPAGIVTEEGTCTAPLSLRRSTVTGRTAGFAIMTVALALVPAVTPAAGHVERRREFFRVASANPRPDVAWLKNCSKRSRYASI